MPLDAFGAFAIALVTLIFWLIVLRERPVSTLAKSYFWWSFFISLWSVGYGVTLSGLLSSEITLIWNKYCQAMAMMIGPFFFKFGCHVAEEFTELRKKIFRGYLVFGAVNAIALFVTPYYVKGLWSFGEYTYQPLGGPLYTIFTAFFVWCTLHTFAVVARNFNRTSGTKRKQNRLWLVATGASYFGGVTLFLQAYHLPIPSHGVFLICVHALVIGCAVLRYHFLGIHVLIRKTLVFTGLFAMVMAVVAGVSAMAEGFVRQFTGEGTVFSTALSVLIAVFLYQPTRKLLVHVTDKYLFQKRLEIGVILNRLSQSVITILDTKDVGEKVLSTLEDTLRLKSGAVFLKDPHQNNFKLIHSFGLKQTGQAYDEDHPFIKSLTRIKQPIHLRQRDQREKLSPPALHALEALETDLCIPLFMRDQLIGILLLGKKKSDQEFTSEELHYLPTVSSQVAIALSNARLYDTVKRSRINFTQQSKMAAIGARSAGSSHEVKNPLSIIQNGFEFLKIKRKSGKIKDMTKEEFENLVFDMVETGIQSVERATSVIDRLTRFSKKPKELMIDSTSIEPCIDQAFLLVKSEFDALNIEFKKEMTQGLPNVICDKSQMEDILLNLFVIARHAIREKGEVSVTGVVHPTEVELTIKDSGKGIRAEDLERIFDPFFTTKDTSRNPDPKQITGTGLGLFLFVNP